MICGNKNIKLHDLMVINSYFLEYFVKHLHF